MARTTYKEPLDFFPEEVRKEFGLGEYNTDVKPAEESEEEERDLNKKIRDYVNKK